MGVALALLVLVVSAALLLGVMFWATTAPDPVPGTFTGVSFPRCATCSKWPGPDEPCPETKHVEEATDGCRKHPEAIARRAKLDAEPED